MVVRRLILPLLLLTACQTRLCRDPKVWTPSEYTAPHVSQPPSIDGNLDDAAWKSAPWTQVFPRSGDFSVPTHKTRAKLVWDDTNLYVAFEVEDNDIVTKDPDTEKPFLNDDDKLYTSEVVEIFLNAKDDQKLYNELEISPLNKIFDASFTGRRQGMNTGWSSGMTHAVQVRGTVNMGSDIDEGWTAEAAIPFANLSGLPNLPPKVGERWRFNMFRLDHGRSVGEEGQAFSPVMIGDFHNLPKFGFLILGGP